VVPSRELCGLKGLQCSISSLNFPLSLSPRLISVSSHGCTVCLQTLFPDPFCEVLKWLNANDKVSLLRPTITKEEKPGRQYQTTSGDTVRYVPDLRLGRW